MKESVCTNILIFNVLPYLSSLSSLNRFSPRFSTCFLISFVIIVSGISLSEVSQADVTVLDDTGQSITLKQPARRIVSLAPHVTELLFAAGAGEFVIGVDSYSDYPELAKKIKNVGSQTGFDLETIVSLKPDLIVVWGSGNSSQTIQKLKSFGLTVFITEPGSIEDVATMIQKLGVLTGHDEIATESATKVRTELHRLKQKYLNSPKVRVFYQIWHQPLMTINDKHIISDVIRLCGGINVFSGLSILAPKINLEAVLAENPQVIIASGMAEVRPEWIEDWRKWSQLDAVKKDNLYFVPPDYIQRHTPRVLIGAKMLCEHLDAVRNKAEFSVSK